MPARVAALSVPGEDYESDSEPEEDEGELDTLQARTGATRRNRSRNCGLRWTLPGAAIALFLVWVGPKLGDRDSRIHTQDRDEVYRPPDDAMQVSAPDPLEADLDAIVELPGVSSTTSTSTSSTSTSSSSSTSTSTSSTSTSTSTSTSSSSSTSTSTSSTSSSSTSTSTSSSSSTSTTSTSTSSTSSSSTSTSSTSTTSTSTTSTSTTSTSTTTTSTTSTTTTVIVRMPARPEVALGAALGTVLGTALAVSMGVGLGLSGGLGIYYALGSLTVSVPDASSFSQNAQAIQAVKRTLARMAGDEVDETAVELVLPCVPGAFFSAYRPMLRRLQETINICFNIRVEGEDNSIRVCQRLSEFGPGAADRFLGAELPGGNAQVINWTAAPNPFAANPNLNIGAPPPGFNPQTGIALG